MRQLIVQGAKVTMAQEALLLEIHRLIVEALAKIRAIPASEIWREIKKVKGSFEIDSREAENIISALEAKLNQELAKIEDLEPEQLTSLDVLAELILKRYTGGLEKLKKVEGF